MVTGPEAPRVSVLMPVYNAERSLIDAVVSILEQTFSDFEFLILNDGSTDGSLGILQQFAESDPRIRLFSRENSGLVAALNEMLSHAQGEFIARMDADDVSEPTRFAAQLDLFAAEKTLVCVGTHVLLIDTDGRPIGVLESPTTHEEIDASHLIGHCSICHPTAMFQRSALIRVGGYRSDRYPTEDHDVYLGLAEFGRLANVPEPLLRYRIHDRSISAKNQELQRRSAELACRDAWERRGLSGMVFEADAPWRASSSRESRLEFALQYGWMAFNNQNRETALHFGWRAVVLAPWSRKAWTLVACALLKLRRHPQ